MKRASFDYTHDNITYRNNTTRDNILSDITAKSANLEFAAIRHATPGRPELLIVASESSVKGLLRENINAWRKRFDCMVLNKTQFADLIYDASGNDAKRIMRDGTIMRGCVPCMRGAITPSRPTAITYAEMTYNMARLGFKLHGPPERKTVNIRAEYLIAGMMFGRNSRIICAGIPVILCKNSINYGLLSFLAHRYGFAGKIYGILSELKNRGRIVCDSLDTFAECGVRPLPTDSGVVCEALRVYEC